MCPCILQVNYLFALLSSTWDDSTVLKKSQKWCNKAVVSCVVFSEVVKCKIICLSLKDFRQQSPTRAQSVIQHGRKQFFLFYFAHTNNYNILHLQFITGNCYHLQIRNKKKRKDKVHKTITINSVYIRSIKKRELLNVYREDFQSILRKQRPFPFLRNVIPPRSWVADQTPIREIWVYFFKRR